MNGAHKGSFFLSFSSHPPPFLLICIYIFLTVFGQKSGQKSGHWPEKVGFLLYFSCNVRKSPKMTGQKPTFAKKKWSAKKPKKGLKKAKKGLF